jgi:hypothetical protein
MAFAQVVVRFGATLVDVRQLRPGDAFRIGTARDVDLPLDVAGLRSFPLVEVTATACVVRVPAGFVARRGLVEVIGVAPATEEPTVLRFGAVAIAITRVSDPYTHVARPALDRRPPAYHAASLVTHVAVWALAITLATPERAKPKRQPVVLRHARIVPAPPQRKPEPPKPKPPEPRPNEPRNHASPQVASTQHPPRSAEPGATQPAVTGPLSSGPISASVLAGITKLARVVDEAHVVQRLAEAQQYIEDDVHPGDFGKGKAFDPTGRPEFGTIATGRYQTTDHGAAAGDNYSVEAEHERVHVRLCDGPCLAVGGVARDDVDTRLGYKKHQLADCYRAGVAETLAFELDIAADGTVKETRISSPIGGCIAKVVAATSFPRASIATRVAYSITFELPYTFQGPTARKAPQRKRQRGGIE